MDDLVAAIEHAIDDNAKRSISLRVHSSDYGKVKAISRRLRVRESDVFRFVIKVGLNRLALLYNIRVRGRDLMPLFLDCGADLVRHFRLDERRLDQLLNEDLGTDDRRVDNEDLALLALANMPERLLFAKAREIAAALADADELPHDRKSSHELLRKYLSAKYAAGEHP
jgi:hypothetical protein